MITPKVSFWPLTCTDMDVNVYLHIRVCVRAGTLSRFDRKAAQAMIEERGGKAAGSVSKRTTYVVAGEAAGSKLKKAEDLGIPVLTEEAFAKMLE